MNIDLTLVIPAYNEADRLPPYLRTVRDHFSKSALTGYEVIVVDDGSLDGTAGILNERFRDWPELLVLRQPANRGKGAAVRRGILAARGRLVLFADADGATPIDEESKLRTAIEKGADVAVGSRSAHAGGTAHARRWHRRITGPSFAFVAKALLRLSVRDPQCGFKMFRGEAGVRLFGECHEDGYLFDIHVLALADRLHYRTAEVGVCWSDVPGSKLLLFRDSYRMLVGLFRLRRALAAAYSVGGDRTVHESGEGSNGILDSLNSGSDIGIADRLEVTPQERLGQT